MKFKKLFSVFLICCVLFVGLFSVGASADDSEQITNLDGTKWYFNETLSPMPVPSDTVDSYNTPFICDGTIYTKFRYGQQYGSYPKTLISDYLVDKKQYTIDFYYYESRDNVGITAGWVDEKYRFVEFSSSFGLQSNDLTNTTFISWLYDNARLVESLTIKNTTINFLSGMTWEEFINSDFNTTGFYTENGKVLNSNGSYYINNVSSTDIINSFTSYPTTQLPISSRDISPYFAELQKQISVSTIVTVIALAVVVTVGFVFMYWGVRKLINSLILAFKKGKISL